jgi:hypothetical protein
MSMKFDKKSKWNKISIDEIENNNNNKKLKTKKIAI